jgi:hypothetical protein
MSNGTQSGGGLSPLVAGGIGVVVGAAIVVGGVSLGILTSGDEAPIRVRNGSIDLELYQGKKWTDDGDKKHWKPKTGTRHSNSYEILIAPSNAANCPGGLTVAGQTVHFGYSDGTTIDLTPQGNKTKVTSSADLEKSSDEGTISYKGNGYISLVRVDSTNVCTFSANDSKLSIVLIDP